ncbi:hypothetical protein FOXB_05033 [Fusarium oxysporum f. sp. conglutinans Fo5176]|uniref:Uncharacterized protein n=2 Tax=Fusarium oxysporum f. sp. conglutinans TaxID=100902 RepID=F9FF54_FUSOF|nr:hypothetical protein FOXB_05033 [Fusarium oxysporum f. sp. conglutinans Fo5176]
MGPFGNLLGVFRFRFHGGDKARVACENVGFRRVFLCRGLPLQCESVELQQLYGSRRLNSIGGPKSNVEAKHPDIDMSHALEWRTLKEQRGTNLDIDVNGHKPQVKRVSHANINASTSREHERLVVDEGTRPGVKESMKNPYV